MAFIRVALAACALALLAAGCAHEESRARTTAPAVGIHYDCVTDAAAHRPRVFRLLQAAHVGVIRVNLNWRALQPLARGEWQPAILRSADQCVSLARRRGLALDLVLAGSPDWARRSPEDSVPADPRDYAQALAALARRYRGSVLAWEIGNEPNNGRLWTGTPADYASMLRAAYPAAKRVDPRALVVFGGVYRSDVSWIERAYAAGAGGSFDVMAIHPYPPDRPAGPAGVHRLMAEHGDGAKPIWFTEIGWSAPFRVTPAEQARELTAFFRTAPGDLPYVKRVFVFQAVNASPGASPWAHDLQILNDDLTARPAYFALKRVAAAAASGTS